ncbi:MAG: DNA polymerase III subunit gamma/tau [Thermomicrobiales bacterium]
MSEGSLFDIESVAPLAAPDQSVLNPEPAETSSLYRKYRPQSFAADDLFGQDHVVHTLRNAIALNRIAHAYLFCGPRGTGKTTTARLMAKAVNCLNPDPQIRPCNACDACVAINRNATTDVIEIDAASNRGIDDIRELRERVKYAPTQLRTKFYIIDEAHQITGAAANAFLKTLEEPPPHTKFILATTDPEELLPTIVSRCQRFDFRRISLDAMTACLRKVARLESIDIQDDAIDAIARHATGSLRDGLGLLDQVSLYREHGGTDAVDVTAELVRTVLGISRNERVEAVFEAIANRDPGKGLTVIGKAVEDGDDIRQFAKQLLAYARLLMLERAQGASDADAIAKALAQRFDLRELASIAQRFGDVDFKIKHAVLPQLPVELAFIDVTLGAAGPTQPRVQPTATREPDAYAAPATPYEPREKSESPAAPRTRLRDRVRETSAAPATSAQRSETSSGDIPPAPMSQATSQAPELPPSSDASTVDVVARNNAELSLETIIDLWPRIRADVKALDRKAEAIMQQVDPVNAVGTRVTLTSSYEFHRNRLNSDEIRVIVEDVISRLVGTQVQVTCVSRDEAAALRSRASGPSSESSMSAPQAANTTVESRADVTESPSVEASTADDETRITAVRNIFDADEIFD